MADRSALNGDPLDLLQYPFTEDGKRIIPGAAGVRDKEHVVGDAPDPGIAGGDDAVCGDCGKKIARRSIKPGPLLCTRCRGRRETDTSHGASKTKSGVRWREAPMPESPRPVAPVVSPDDEAVQRAYTNGLIPKLAEKIRDGHFREHGELMPKRRARQLAELRLIKDAAARRAKKNLQPHDADSCSICNSAKNGDGLCPAAQKYVAQDAIGDFVLITPVKFSPNGPVPNFSRARGRRVGANRKVYGLAGYRDSGSKRYAAKTVKEAAERMKAIRLARQKKNAMAQARADWVDTPPPGCSAKAWEALRLVEVEGLTGTEAGKRLGIGRSAASQLIARARMSRDRNRKISQ